MTRPAPSAAQPAALAEATLSIAGTPRVFISYRRDDSAGDSGRLYDALTARFGRESVFMDIDTILPGADFAGAITEAVSSCDVFVAVIGKQWLGAADTAGHRRLEDDRDFVRLEIQAALERNLRVIPVLVQGAPMPTTGELPGAIDRLAARNAFELSYDRWHYDAARLIATIEESARKSSKDLIKLPDQLTSFVGRQQEINAVEQLFARVRLVTLTGAGGIGKTRLAIEVAARAGNGYRDGVRMVELASLADPDLLANSVAFALGLGDRAGHPIAATLTDYLRSRQLLLVLDNCEHLVQAAAGLADSLLRTCPELRILATSQEALQIDGETIYRVPPLSVPEPGTGSAETFTDYGAVALFYERAKSALGSFDLTPQSAERVAKICKRLDGIPLAIELAAARVNVLSLDQILMRLDSCFRLLTRGSRTALPRHQTLRATIEWSYQLLSESERVMMRRLSIFAGGASLDAAEAVCANNGIDQQDVLDLLSGLVNKSLLLADTSRVETRFRLLETVRQFGLEQLRDAGELSPSENRHRTWFYRLVERAEPALRGPEQFNWSETLESEHDNLRAAFEGYVQNGEVEACLRMAGSMGWFWHVRGHLSEGREALHRALSQGANASASLRASAVCWESFLAGDQGNSTEALDLGEQSLAIYRETADRWGTGFALQTLGRTAVAQDDHPRAQQVLAPTLSIFRETGDKWALSRSLYLLGVDAFSSGDYVQATAQEQESLALSRELGDSWHIAGTLSTLGQIELSQGSFESAKGYLQETLSVLRGGSNYQAAMALHRLGVVARCQQDADGATTLQQRSLALSKESGDKISQAYALCELAILAQRRQNFDQAKALLNEALTLLHDAGDRFGTAKTFEALAVVARFRDDPSRAAALFGAAGALREKIASPVEAFEREGYETELRLLKTRLGGSGFATAWSIGRTMTPEQLLEYALEGN